VTSGAAYAISLPAPRIEMETGERSDLDIIGEVLDGDTNRFEVLIDRHREHVFRIVGRRVPAGDAAEVAHDVFVRAWTSLPSFRAESPFEYWLSKIAVRTCHDYWRDRYRSKEAPMSSLGEEHAEWLENTMTGRSGASFESAESGMMARDLMMRALAQLSPADRAVIELVHLEERPVREAADMLGWSVANVKVRAHRSRRKLRKIIEKMEETG
jgi:RNA polymerase sigma-70 factor (ECF subfamily)